MRRHQSQSPLGHWANALPQPLLTRSAAKPTFAVYRQSSTVYRRCASRLFGAHEFVSDILGREYLVEARYLKIGFFVGHDVQFAIA